MKKAFLKTPVGLLEISEENEKITGIRLSSDNVSSEENESPLLLKATDQLSEYFSGKRKNFDFPLEFSGTNFQKSVWNELLKIPFGETKTYGEIAKAIGKPKAARAVGSACNKNRLLIAVPCHRVIGAGGALTGFACGTDRKEWLLGHEAQQKGEHQ